MTQAPLVSVVIPAYNEGLTLADAVNSVLVQTVSDLEVIVVDDGSPDDTAEVARAIDDSRVRVITQSNQGVCVARNAGISAAAGEYVAFLDGDDLWLPHKLERQLEFLGRNSHVSAVQTGVMVVDSKLEALHAAPCHPSEDPLMDTLLFKNLPAFPSTLLMRRDKLEEIGGFDTSLVILEDWTLAIEAARRCNLASLEEPLALYRLHGGNRSRDLSMHVAPGYAILDRLFEDATLPPHIRTRKQLIYARFFTMLAGGAFRNREWAEWARWTAKAARTDPRSVAYMADLPARKLRRVRSRRRASWAARAVDRPTVDETLLTDRAGHSFRLAPIKCPICSVDDTKFLGWRGGGSQREGRGVPTRIVRCRRCGLLYPNPFPYPQDPNALYGDPETYFADHDDEKKVEGYRELLQELKTMSGLEKPSLLDVGCGTGEGLHAARLLGIQDAVGLEFADAMVDQARERYGVEVVVATVEDYDPGRSFDIVVLGAIIEHVYDPGSFMAAVARLTKPGGIVWIDTPREPNLTTILGNLVNRVRGRQTVYNLAPTWVPYHVFGFNPRALHRLLDAHGFEVERTLLRHGMPNVPPTDDGLRARTAAWLGTQVIRLGNLTPLASNMFVWARRRSDLSATP